MNIRSLLAKITNHKSVVIQTLLVFLPVILIVSAAMALYYNNESHSAEKVLMNEDVYHVRNQSRIINNYFETVIADLVFLSEQDNFQSMLATGDDEDMSTLANDWLIFSGVRNNYDQISFIDEAGLEIIRINYNQ